LSEDLENGAYYDYTAKLGLIKISKETHDICQDEKYLHVKCPQKKGEDVVWESRDIMMGRVPPAKWNLVFEGFTANDDDLFCIQARADTRPIRSMSSSSSRVKVDDAAFRVQA
jgi:hypothetical protein